MKFNNFLWAFEGKGVNNFLSSFALGGGTCPLPPPSSYAPALSLVLKWQKANNRSMVYDTLE